MADPVYIVAYSLCLASVGAVLFSVYLRSRTPRTSLAPSRFLGLTRDEVDRLFSGDAVFLMHLSIALGVALSIAMFLLDPVLQGLVLLRFILLAASVPITAGLVAAFAWRITRYMNSKRVEKELTHSTPDFTRSSDILQTVLMLAIGLTASELVLAWSAVPRPYSFALGVFRNSLVAIYYSRPTVNLVRNFDKPLPKMETPFQLADILSGKTDASQISVGVSKSSEFEPAQKLSFDSCVEIGACEAACPATAAGRPLSPRVLVRQLSLLQKGEDGHDPDVFSSVTEDELWSCTSCGACVSSCPVGVQHLDLVYDLRRSLVAQGKLDREKSTMLENLARSNNPYGLKAGSRGDWASGLGIDTMASKPEVEYVYWVGCLSSFDQRAQNIARSMAKILKLAGVSFAILGNEESCTGDPARRLGEEGRYQELAYHNIEKLNSYKAKKVIATCPHCFNSLKNEYPQFGGNYEVVYHTQLISDLIKEGRIRIPAEMVRKISVTLHDACYASRYNDIFEEPRTAISATGSELLEMTRRKEKTFCCGAGGSNYWFKVPQQKSIAGIRTEEARATGAKEIATECPFCLSMLEDASKVAGTGMEVKDVAEIVAECLH